MKIIVTVTILIQFLLLVVDCQPYPNYYGECRIPKRFRAYFINDASGLRMEQMTAMPVGASVTMLCEDGYAPTSQSTNGVCQSSGNWQPGFTICERQYSDGSIGGGGGQNWFTRAVINVRTAQSTYQPYTATPLMVVTPEGCGNPPAVEHGFVEVGSSAFWAQRKITCMVGFSVYGADSIFCQPNRRWSQPGVCYERKSIFFIICLLNVVHFFR